MLWGVSIFIKSQARRRSFPYYNLIKRFEIFLSILTPFFVYIYADIAFQYLKYNLHERRRKGWRHPFFEKKDPHREKILHTKHTHTRTHTHMLSLVQKKKKRERKILFPRVHTHSHTHIHTQQYTQRNTPSSPSTHTVSTTTHRIFILWSIVDTHTQTPPPKHLPCE